MYYLSELHFSYEVLNETRTSKIKHLVKAKDKEEAMIKVKREALKEINEIDILGIHIYDTII